MTLAPILPTRLTPTLLLFVGEGKNTPIIKRGALSLRQGPHLPTSLIPNLHQLIPRDANVSSDILRCTLWLLKYTCILGQLSKNKSIRLISPNSFATNFSVSAQT